MSTKKRCAQGARKTLDATLALEREINAGADSQLRNNRIFYRGIISHRI